jgi:DNA-directed RNA polymerase subunit RPC12/RpoP
MKSKVLGNRLIFEDEFANPVPTESAWIKEKEYLLSEISGKVKCPACEKKLFIGDDYENPSLFCVCGYRAMIKLLQPI